MPHTAGRYQRGKRWAEAHPTLSTVQRARAERPLETRDAFFAALRSRLEKAAQLAEARIAGGDLAAAYVLIQAPPRLESFDDKARCLAAS